MKKALGFASNILFFVLIIVLIALMVSYTLSFVGTLFPNDPVKQWGTLAIFDVGAVVWFMVFLFKAKGAGQRGTSLLGLVVDFVGSLIIVAAEVFTAAQSYLTDPATAAWLRETATYVLVIWLGINIALTYIFHITDPKTQEEMRARNIQDDVTAKALDMAEAKVNVIASDLADELSERIKIDVLAQLNITNKRLLPSPPVIDAKAVDTPPKAKHQPIWKTFRPSLKMDGNAANNAPRQNGKYNQTVEAIEPAQVIEPARPNGAGDSADPTNQRQS